jgi:hypothetical protein
VGFGALCEEDWGWGGIIEGGGERWGFVFFHCERVGELESWRVGELERLKGGKG